MVKRKRIGALALTSAMVIGLLGGCSQTVTGTDPVSYPLTATLTRQEVLDYYSKALEYDTIISRNAEADINNYEVTDVKDQAKVAILNKALEKTQSLLKGATYDNTIGNNQYLTESTFNYIKAMLNDKKITGGNVVSMTQALGYYFIDVEYTIKAADIGTFKPSATLLGLSGSFVHSDYFNTDSVDTAFMSAAVKKLNEYYTANKINKTATFDAGSLTFSVSENGGSGSIGFVDQPTTPDTTPSDATGEPGGLVDATAPGPVDTTDTGGSIAVNSQGVLNSRTTGIDIEEFVKAVGYSTNKAYIPDLDMFYNIPSASDGIQGIGLYPSGDGGLKIFGMNREGLAGSLTMRYVYKENLTNPSEISCENIYPIYYEITSGYSANNDSIIPDFLAENFEVLVEKADRAIVNCDISGLMSGNVFSDIGMGALVGYQTEYSNVLRQISTLRRIISRNIEDNAYLVELETYRQEGPKSADVYGNYKDKVYAVIEQNGSEFVITDYMTMSRQLVTEPEIRPDDATAKRVVSLGLTGEISDDTKQSVTTLIDDLYKASTLRVLNGPFDTNVGGSPVTIERGMYDCFNSNVEMLSSTRLEELNNNIRTLLVKYGVNVKCDMNGKVTEWIGGTSNQVEFTTEEVFTYQGRNDGVYQTCYYLVSSMEDIWVIDEIQILSQEELSGEGLNAVVSRING